MSYVVTTPSAKQAAKQSDDADYCPLNISSQAPLFSRRGARAWNAAALQNSTWFQELISYMAPLWKWAILKVVRVGFPLPSFLAHGKAVLYFSGFIWQKWLSNVLLQWVKTLIAKWVITWKNSILNVRFFLLLVTDINVKFNEHVLMRARHSAKTSFSFSPYSSQIAKARVSSPPCFGQLLRLHKAQKKRRDDPTSLFNFADLAK